MAQLNKTTLKALLNAFPGAAPLTAELYFTGARLLNREPSVTYSLKVLQSHLPTWVEQTRAALAGPSLTGGQPRRRIAIFGMRAFWLQHLAAIGLVEAAMGHAVELGYLPYHKPDRPAGAFDERRQDVYIRETLRPAQPLLSVQPLLEKAPARAACHDLPGRLPAEIEDLAFRDVQYMLQQERVATDSDLYRLRLQRDALACAAALEWFRSSQPDLLIVPNGAILEYEAVHRAARYLDIQTATFEFFDMAERTWIAHNTDAMHQDTNALWAARKDTPLSRAQVDELARFFAGRKGPQASGQTPESNPLVLRYQGIPTQGAAELRRELGLDERPVALLTTNVIGDSLTLGRQVFSQHMTEWLEKTILYFARRPEMQFVVRIHPGELITRGPSVAGIVQDLLPELPAHIHLIPAEAKVNTYDLIEAADLGLVYTTTAGLEMAMSGVPVIVAGSTHYRGRGFTLDPNTWEEFYALLDRLPAQLPALRLQPAQVDLAWNYAYRYFIEFPHPFPWHLRNFAKDIERWPLARVLSPEGMDRFGQTFRYLAGQPVAW